jgi:uncharacterized protein
MCINLRFGGKEGTFMKDRMEVLDILRGFALVGIFIVNIHLMTSGSWVYEQSGIRQEEGGLDLAAGLLVTLFFEGAFITLFTFLFGIGFHLFMVRAEKKSYPARRLFLRRMSGLLVLGLVHLFVFWMGDILTIYAVTGFLLLLFYHCQPRTLLIWASGMLVTFFLLLLSRSFIPAGRLQLMREEGEMMGGAVESAYEGAVSWSWIVFRVTEEVPWVLSESVFLLPFVLGMFLLGMYAGKKGWFVDLLQWRSVPFVVYTGSVLLFAGLGCIIAVLETGVIYAGAQHMFLLDTLTRSAGVLLAFLYTAAIVHLLLRKGSGGWVMTTLQSMGRMALTNYLLQTVLALTFIYTFGLYGQTGTAASLLLAVSILVFQAFLSRWIMNRWKQGPLESLWRRFTYRKVKKVHTQDRLEARALLFGAATYLLMAGLAWVTYYYSHSEAILLDGNYSFIMFIGVITALKISAVKARRTKTFPLGQFFYESLYAFMKGLLILGVLIMAASTAVIRIVLYATDSTAGIPMLIPGPILYYAAACTVICYGISLFYRTQYERTGRQSILMKTEQKAAFVDGTMSLGIAAGVFFLMQGGGTTGAGFVPYLADSVFVLILTVILIREPLSMIRESVIELAGGKLQSRDCQSYFEEVIHRHTAELWHVEDVFISKNGSRYILMVYISPLDGVFNICAAEQMKTAVLTEVSDRFPHVYLQIIPEAGSGWTMNVKEGS